MSVTGTGSRIKAVATMSNGVLTVSTVCPACGTHLQVRLLQCDGPNKLMACPNCRGACAVVISLTESPNLLRRIALAQIDVDGLNVIANGRALSVYPGNGVVNFAVAWYATAPAPTPAVVSIQPRLTNC